MSKALEMDVFRPAEIEVVDTGGAPAVTLHGAVAARARELGVAVRVSLTHTRTTAGAVAILV